jgi:hypothetical protein
LRTGHKPRNIALVPTFPTTIPKED